MAHWNQTYKPARFFALDARAGIPLLISMVHVDTWTIGLTVVVMAVFYVLERRGLSLPSAFRAFRAWIIGDARPPLGVHKQRGPVDHARRVIR